MQPHHIWYECKTASQPADRCRQSNRCLCCCEVHTDIHCAIDNITGTIVVQTPGQLSRQPRTVLLTITCPAELTCSYQSIHHTVVSSLQYCHQQAFHCTKLPNGTCSNMSAHTQPVSMANTVTEDSTGNHTLTAQCRAILHYAANASRGSISNRIQSMPLTRPQRMGAERGYIDGAHPPQPTAFQHWIHTKHDNKSGPILALWLACDMPTT